ncbi:MAG: V-type ATP synthase subunit I [Spirochaetia bacterium]
MIVPMKRVAVLVLENERAAATSRLQQAGLLHVEIEAAESEDLDRVRRKLTRLQRAKAVLPELESQPARSTDDLAEANARTQQLLQEIESRVERKRELDERREHLTREISRTQAWGDFNADDVRQLAEKGVQIRLYHADSEIFEDIPQKNVFVLSRTKTDVYFIQVDLGHTPALSIDPVHLPEQGPSAMSKELSELANERSAIDGRLEEIAKELPVIEMSEQALLDELEYETTKAGMEDYGPVAVVTGYVPGESLEHLQSLAQEQSWGLYARDPNPDEQPPTLVRNHPVVRMIQPVFKLLGTVPGYREFDISALFLGFFTVFFGMIIGDAGYGALILLTSLYFAAKTKGKGKSVPDGLRLLMLLSGATVVWGGITGNWFGVEAIAQLPVFSAIIVEPLAAWNPASTENVQMLCFIMGTVHLVLAHGWRLISGLKRVPRVAALADAGWLIVVLGLYYVVLNIVLDPLQFPIPDYALYMIGAGLVSVIVFGQQQEGLGFAKGILKGVSNLMPTALDGISAFSDIVSYIRLYAVGLATLAIATSFNDMAMEVSAAIPVAGVGVAVAILVLLFGHTLNLIMAALAVVVHGVRLNMLEFSGHLGMEWIGAEYSPFRKKYSIQQEETS